MGKAGKFHIINRLESQKLTIGNATEGITSFHFDIILTNEGKSAVPASQKQAKFCGNKGKVAPYSRFSPCVPKPSPLLTDPEIISNLFFIQ